MSIIVEQSNNLLCVSDQGVRLFARDLLATLGLNGVDEGLQLVRRSICPAFLRGLNGIS